MARFIRSRTVHLALTLLIFVAVLPVAPAQAVSRQIVLQQGLNSYSGVSDTWISRLDWDNPPQYTVNYGRNEDLVLSRDGGENPVLRFDLSGIPANSKVSSAVLRLYNTTRSSSSGSGSYARRINLYQVLQGWDEGNQAASPIDAKGKHGATGDESFAYYPGEGADVPWHARGMAAGSDYAAAPLSYADVSDAGWYSWDVTTLVSNQVRGKQPNYGVVLRDATGYDERQPDNRNFRSSQYAAQQALRPELLITYNPDTPYADAGPDQENLGWQGGAVTLDGSGSHDRPGGNDSTLTYEWRIATGGYGTKLSGLVHKGPKPVVTFVPDVPGEWTVSLKVTSEMGETATDLVNLRLLRIGAAHPRIYLSPAKISQLKARATASDSRWVQLENWALDPGNDSWESMAGKALVSIMNNNPSTCSDAVSAALGFMADPDHGSMTAGGLALIYDWCHGQVSAADRQKFINYLNTWGDYVLAHPDDLNDSPGWGNYWPRYGYDFALMGLATFGDNPRAAEWLNEFRHRRYRDVDLPLLKRIEAGGGWPEGMLYDFIANWPRVKALEAWRTAAGEDLFQSTTWYRDRPGYALLHRWPGLADQYGHKYHPYVSTGDSERNRGSIANYERIMDLILIERFSSDPIARQLQAYLASPKTGNSMSFLYHEEFLWFNPAQPTATPGLLTHYAPGTGSIFMRSGWPSKAADTDPSPTYLTFQAGDHFTYHQHYDQNSFTLHKYGDLALDSGVYSGDGRSYHDVNYYVRTIAHNTLVVYNPSEDMSAARPDASSNDGGQRTMYPASRSPQSTSYFDQYGVQYHTGSMKRFEDSSRYTYALGDATAAYNNPTYNQTMDTGLTGNVAKVTRFQREFVYLRPKAAGGLDFLVLFDRVGVTRSEFSGKNTKLLFHTLSQPTVNGKSTTVSPGETLYADPDLVTADSGGGRLFIKTLLPAHRNIRKVGGRAVKAFWVFDANYDWHWDANEPQPRPVSDFDDIPYGEWRVELEPADTALNHNFLNVLHPAKKGTTAMPATTLITGTGVSGAQIDDPALQRVVLFSSSTKGSAPSGTITYGYKPSGSAYHLLLDLKPNVRYKLTSSLKNGVRTVTLVRDTGGSLVAGAQGVLGFTLSKSGALGSEGAGEE